MAVMTEAEVGAAGGSSRPNATAEQPDFTAHPGMDMDDAYAVQADFVRRKLAAGGTIRGWKIGLTSKAMQYALNIDIPDGVLFEDMFFANGGKVPNDRFIEPRIEAEIAFIAKHDLSGANATAADVIAATDHVAPALEFSTRIFRAGRHRRAAAVLDTISDNAANAGIVLGDASMASKKSICGGSAR